VRVPETVTFSRARKDPVLKRSSRGCMLPSSVVEVRVVWPSPWDTELASLKLQRFGFLPAFSACCCSFFLSESGEPVLLEPSSSSSRLNRRSHRARHGARSQHRSDLVTRRMTPLLFGLYSLVTLFGQAFYPDGQLPLKQAAWYHKSAATFGDVLAVVRRHLWDNFTFPTSSTDPDVVLVPSSTLSRLAHAVCY
jgi:hypothetical protein